MKRIYVPLLVPRLLYFFPEKFMNNNAQFFDHISQTREQFKPMPDVVRDVTPKNEDFISTGAGLTCRGEKLVVSINKKDDIRMRKINPEHNIQLMLNGPTVWVKYYIEHYSPEPNHYLIKTDSITAKYHRYPLVDKFSDGALLFTSQASHVSDIDNLLNYPSGVVYQDGIKTDEFCLGLLMQSINIDSHDNIWVCPNDEDLEIGRSFTPRGASESECMSIRAPVCLDRRGVLQPHRMPWANPDREPTILCRINNSDKKISVFFIQEDQMGVIIDRNNNYHDWNIEMMAKYLNIFAYHEKTVLTYDLGGTLRMHTKESPMKSLFEFYMDNLFPLRDQMLFSVGREDDLHFLNRNQWLIFRTDSVRKQFENWEKGKNKGS